MPEQLYLTLAKYLSLDFYVIGDNIFGLRSGCSLSLYEIAEKPVQTMICYSGDAGFVKNPSCPLYQVIITSFFRVALLFFGPVPRRLTG